jgi:hypothetical protein
MNHRQILQILAQINPLVSSSQYDCNGSKSDGNPIRRVKPNHSRDSESDRVLLIGRKQNNEAAQNKEYFHPKVTIFENLSDEGKRARPGMVMRSEIRVMEQHDRARGQEPHQIELWKTGSGIHESLNISSARVLSCPGSKRRSMG